LLRSACSIKEANSEVEINYKYKEIKTGYLSLTNTDKAMERKGDEAKMQKYSCKVLK
jgi:hypothetical protein